MIHLCVSVQAFGHQGWVKNYVNCITLLGWVGVGMRDGMHWGSQVRRIQAGGGFKMLLGSSTRSCDKNIR